MTTTSTPLPSPKLGSKSSPPRSEFATSRLDSFLLKALIVIALGATVIFSYLYGTASRETRVSAESIVGTPLPAFLEPSLSFKTEEGMIAQLLHPGAEMKVSVVVAPPSLQAQGRFEPSLVEKARSFRTDPSRSPFAPLVGKFLLGQFNPLRATQAEDVPLRLGEEEVRTTAFKGKKGEYFLIAVLNRPNAQIAVVGFSTLRSVPTGQFQEVLEALPLLRSPRDGEQ